MAISHQPGWHAGWYWETDDQQRVLCLRPGADVPDGLKVDWDALACVLAQGPHLWDWWGGTARSTAAESQALEPLARLKYHLLQQVSWEGDLVLPWPDGLTAWQWPGHADQVVCRLRGRRRQSPDGRFIGHCGVMVPVAAGPAASTANQAAAQAARDDALQTRLAEQEMLRYALSHDLRAPLRVIDGFARIVKEDYASALGKLGGDHLDRVLAAAQRMNGMIDAVLAQAQLSGEPLSRAEVDVSQLGHEVLSDLLSLRDPAAPAVGVVVAPDLRAQADPALLRRVLENLLGNALKYSAKVSHPRIELGRMPATNPDVFYVRDNGAGFDMQHADKLFGMFQRLHSAREFQGTGVGLAGVQAIVRRHGGRIWAEAQPGQGACFYFTLMDALQAQGLK
jgi:signal transduction histidine kinase